MPTLYGPKCARCGHPTRMLAMGQWRDIACACPDTPGAPPHHHAGPGPAPWSRPDGVHHQAVPRVPIARLVREKLAAARANRQQGNQG